MGEILVIEPIEIVYHKKQVEASVKKIQPIVFHVPSPFPYQNSKVVQWKYNATVLVVSVEIQFPKVEIVNIAGPRGMTRSGRVFAPKYTPIVVPAIVPTLQVGASVCVPTTLAGEPESSGKTPEATILKGMEAVSEKEQVEKVISIEEGQEFLKLIKQSDFKIVDQLGQTPSKISILSSLLSSEAHRKALLKVLNTDNVMQYISVEQFDGVVAKISASRYLGFN